MNLYGGLDIGTNGVRLLVVNESLEVLFEEAINYQTSSPQEGWAEQNPDDIFKACLKLFGELVDRYPDGDIFLTFSSVMHSLVGVDKCGRKLTPLIIWADTRSREQKAYLQRRYGKGVFYKNTSCPLHSTYWPAKILWMKETFSQDFYHFVSIKEYIIYQLCAEWRTDYSLASTCGLFNLKRRIYDQEILKIIGIDEEQLSAVYSGTASFEFAIKGHKIKGFMGATDGVLANLGVGAIKSNQSVITVGSSSAARFISREPVLDPEERAWCYMLDENFYVIGEATNGAGILLKWLVDIFNYSSVEELLRKNVPAVPYPGNEIICIPTMMAERGPGYNENLRGLLYGLSLNHSQRDIITALYESIALFLKMVFEDVKRVNGSSPDSIIMTGGLGLSEGFMKLVNYLIGEVTYIPGYEQNTAVGAAMMAIKQVKDLEYQEIIKNLPHLKSRKIVKRDEEFAGYLDNKYKRIIKIYNLLEDNL